MCENLFNGIVSIKIPLLGSYRAVYARNEMGFHPPRLQLSALVSWRSNFRRVSDKPFKDVGQLFKTAPQGGAGDGLLGVLHVGE